MQYDVALVVGATCRVCFNDGMGWMRTLLLGDIGNRLDIEDTERDIANLRRNRAADARGIMEQGRIILALREELGRQKLALTALTRFLIEKGLAEEAELTEFIREVDAEDGQLDGCIPVVEDGHLRLKPGGLPGGGS